MLCMCVRTYIACGSTMAVLGFCVAKHVLFLKQATSKSKSPVKTKVGCSAPNMIQSVVTFVASGNCQSHLFCDYVLHIVHPISAMGGGGGNLSRRGPRP